MNKALSYKGTQQWYGFGIQYGVPRFERIDDMNVYSITRRSDHRICFRDDGAILLPKDSNPWVKTPIFMQLCRDHNGRLGFTEENFPRPGAKP